MTAAPAASEAEHLEAYKFNTGPDVYPEEADQFSSEEEEGDLPAKNCAPQTLQPRSSPKVTCRLSARRMPLQLMNLETRSSYG
jgi:hypothetical protein